LLEENPPSAAKESPPSAAETVSSQIPSEQHSQRETINDVPSTSGQETRQSSYSDAGWWKKWSNIVVGGQLGTSAHWARHLAQESLGRMVGIKHMDEVIRLMKRARERLRRHLVKVAQAVSDHRDALLILVAMAWSVSLASR